jgi:hypothetical protein
VGDVTREGNEFLYGRVSSPLNLAPTFPEIQEELRKSGLQYKASVPDRDNKFIIIAWHRISGNFSTHATEWGNKSVCWGHYDFPTFESARVDALERALHR